MPAPRLGRPPKRAQHLAPHVALERLAPERRIEQPLRDGEPAALELVQRRLMLATRDVHMPAHALAQPARQLTRLPLGGPGRAAKRRQSARGAFGTVEVAEPNAKQREIVQADA